MVNTVLRQFVIFCAVGLINTGIGLSVILLLSELFGVHYMLSNILGYVVGLIIAFILHRKVTFMMDARDDIIKSEFYKFVLVFVICYCIQFGCLYIMVDTFGIYQAYAQIIALGFYTALNYAGHKFFTFNQGKRT